ncbi:MAG TPA: tyrosine/phenylalanine carboxypeptidase domain-containing protein [Actinomycetota bacterium]|nr:tyrosine/phenylalanine carboxypeptidase domain-containing protein [Actinomycetota bacterium]
MNVELRQRLAGAIAIDHALTEIERQIEFLLAVTPANAAEAWADFERNGFSIEPTLQSRPLGFDPDLVRRRLYNLEIETVEDRSLAQLLLAKRDELVREVTLLVDRDTSRFLYGSLQLFGDVHESLEAEATHLLEEIPPAPDKDSHVTATGFAEAAKAELDYYRSRYEGFDLGLEIRPDVADLMVSHGRLLIPTQAVFRSRRVDALVQHEVGTHMLTYANGSVQPLDVLAVGLPGYDETQEGLAVLAEFVSGGLDPHRLRLLAARVIAVARLVAGRGFLEIFVELHDRLGFGPKTAWATTMRVTRFGGLTKDVIYLRGIGRVLEFAHERKDLDSLLVGKLSLEQVPLVEELLEREMLRPPWLRPRWLEGSAAAERLQRVYGGMAARDLIETEARR